MSNIEAYGQVDLEMLKALTEADGISGCEKEASRVMKSYLDEYADEVTYDNLGSIIGLKRGLEDGPRIMISGHLDEVGFMVRKIEDNGYVRMLPVGGWWGHVLPCHRLVITTSNGDKITGMVGAMAPHGLSEEVKNTVIKPIDMFLDLGVSNKEEVEALGVQIGDMITPDTKFEVMNNPNYLCSKAWDDRIGAAVAIDVLKNLQGIDHCANVYAVGSVQEEVGIRGARTSTHNIRPDIAFALDVTISEDTPVDKGEIGLGKGIVLSIVDAMTVSNTALISKVSEIAEELGLEVNYSCSTSGGTDAGNIHKSFDGILATTLYIPTRYMHSHRAIIHRRDYDETVRVLTEFCRRLDRKTLEDIKLGNR